MRQPKFFRHREQALVVGPYHSMAHEPRCREQMHVDITDTGPEQSTLFDQMQDLVTGGNGRFG